MGFAWRKKDSSSFSSSSNSCSSSSSRLPLLPLRHRARGEGGGTRHLPRGVQHLRQEVRCETCQGQHSSSIQDNRGNHTVFSRDICNYTAKVSGTTGGTSSLTKTNKIL